MSEKFNEIESMSLTDEEGQMTTKEINISISRKNGSYTAIEAVYCWRTEQDFDRFIRFINRYAKKYGLEYERK